MKKKTFLKEENQRLREGERQIERERRRDKLSDELEKGFKRKTSP